jgi:multidrug efflux pump subunit AcrA (membrane-fusion protein)
MKHKTREVIALLLGLSILFAGCNSIPGSSQQPTEVLPIVTQPVGIVAEGQLVPANYVNLAFNSGGKAAEILVSEGDHIEAGQLIARLDQREQFSSAVDNASYELLVAQQALKDLLDNADVNTAAAVQKVADERDAVRSAERYLNNLNAGSRQTDIDSASASVVLLKDRLDKAQEDYALYQNKPEDNLKRAEYLSKLADAQQRYDDAVRLLNNLQGSANDIDLAVAEANLSLAQASLSLAEDQYDKVKDGPDPDELASAQAREKAAETALSAAQAALADRDLTAPFAGTIAQLDLKIGEQVNPGKLVVVLADFSQWVVETDDLTEIEVPDTRVGQPVRVTFDALPNLDLPGTVTSISQVHVEQHGDVTYTAKIDLTESDPRLRWGMTAAVHFDR